MKKLFLIFLFLLFTTSSRADNYDLRGQDPNGEWKPLKISADGQIKVSLQGSTGASTDFLNTSFADDQVFVADSVTDGTPRTLPDCDDSGGQHLNYDQATNSFACGTTGGGSTGWTDGGTDVTLTTSTDNVGIGGASLAKLSITGDTDETQFIVRMNSTQTSNGVAFQTSDGTNVFTWTKGGTYTQAGTDTDALTLGGGSQATYVTTYGVTGTDPTVTASDSLITFNHSVTVSGTTTIGTLSGAVDGGGATSFEVPNGSAPTTDAFGEVAGDNNAWAASRGAVQFYDGTANTYLVGVLASDTPSNGQVPTWNTGGTITWETSASGSNTQTMCLGSGTGQTLTHWMGNATNTTEANTVRFVPPSTMTITKIYASVQTAPDNGAGTQSWAVSINDNGTASTDVTCTISEASTSCSDTGSATITGGSDTLSVEWLASGSPAATGTSGVCFEYTQ